MNRDFYIALIYKRFKGELSPEEGIRLDEWLVESSDHQQLFDDIQKDWELSENYEPDIEIDLEQAFSSLQQRIQEDGSNRPEAKIVEIAPRKFRWGWLTAASVMLLLAAGIWWMGLLDNEPQTWATLSTGEGEVQSFTLSDQSIVWLNENSTLEYPEEFKGKNRTVRLTGEGFFDIAHDKAHPFKVETSKTITTVLGTTFNIEAYPESDVVKVALLTGKVRFEEKNDSGNKAEIRAGQSVLFNKTRKDVLVSEQPNQNSTSWQTNQLIFKETDLEQVVSDLSDHFGISISLSENNLKNCKFNGRYSAPTTEMILDNIANIYKAEIVKNDNGFTINGGACK